VAKQVTAAAL